MSEGVPVLEPRHRVAVATGCARAELAGVAGASLWSMGASEAAETLVQLTRLRAQVEELELRVAHHASTLDVGSDRGATSTASWWAHTTRLTRAETHRRTRLAARLAAEQHAPVRAALAAGEVLADQAAVIVDAVDALPTELVDAEVAGRARAHLLAAAADHDATALRVLGRRILDVVAPEVGEAHEASVLEAEERAARSAASFSMVDDGHGRCHGRFTIPSLHGQLLRNHLLALAAPRHRAARGEPVASRELPTRHRLGAALCEYVETRPPTRSATPAGCRPPWW